MQTIGAAGLHAGMDICLAGAFAVTWWIDRSARHNLLWSGGFLALALASMMEPFGTQSGPWPLAVAVVAGPGLALLFGGIRLYRGRGASVAQLLSWLAFACALPAVGFLRGPELAPVMIAGLQVSVFAWIGLMLIQGPAIEKAAGILFLARAALVLAEPLQALPAVSAPLALAVHLASGLALLLATFMRSRLQLGEEARRARDLLERVVEALPATVTVKDGDLRLIVWNSHAGRHFDLPARSILGRALSEVLPGPVTEEIEAIDREVLRGLRPPPREIPAEIAGEPRWILMEKVPLVSGKGVVEGVISASFDITELKRTRDDLERNRDYLLQAQRLGRTGYIVVDNLARRVTWSETVFEIRRVQPREFFSFEEAISFIHPDDRAAYTAARDAGIAEKRPFHTEVRIIRPDGSLIWEHAIGHPNFGADGELLGFMVFLQDVTERRRAEAEALASQQKFVGAFQSSTDLMAIQRGDRGALVEVNDVWLRASGYTRDEVIGRTPAELGSYVLPEQRVQIGDRIRADGHVREVDVKMRRKDGEVRDFRLSGSRILVDDEVYLFWAGRDVTDDLAAERRIAALNAQNEAALRQLRDIADNLPVLISHLDRQRRFRFVNQTGVEWFARSREELVGKSLGEVVGDTAAGLSDDAFDRVLAGHPASMTGRLRYPDGKVRDTEIRYIPDIDPTGSVVGYYSLTIDISDRRRAELALAEKERQLSAIMDNAPMAIFLKDTQGRFQFVNRQYVEWLGKSPDDVYGRTNRDVWPDAPAEVMDASDREILETGAPVITEIPVHELLPGVGVEHVLATKFPILDADGKIVGIGGFAADVTAAKRSEQARRSSEAKFARAFQDSADAMAIVRPDGGGAILETNDAVHRLLGFSREEISGRNGIELGLWPDPATPADIIARALREGAVRDCSARMRRKDGSTFECVLTVSLFEVDGAMLYFWVIRDVSEAKEAERRMQELNTARADSLRQLRDITNNLPVLISYADRDRRTVYVNRTGELWLRTRQEDLFGHPIAGFMPSDYVESTNDVIASVLQGQKMTVERTIDYPDGCRRIVEITYVPDRLDDGFVKGYYTLVADLTGRKATEEQLRQSQRMEAVGNLTGGVAHDFNNLLAVVSGNLEMIDEGLAPDQEQLRRRVATALRATERGATLTRSLLAFARQQPLLPTAIDLHALVRDLTVLMRRTVPADIAVEVVSAAGLWPCEADAGQLQNALLNLVVNARDAMPDGGRLTIELANVKLDDDYAAAHAEVTPGHYVMLAVSDTGHGMPPETLARVFEPFFTTKEVGKGTGLGLSMVFGFAKQSKGHVKIYSEVGQGTGVKLYLPRAAPAEADPPPVRPGAERGRGETILLVEDDPDLRTLAFALLRSLGYEVLDAENGPKALDLLHRHREGVRLLLTDVILPGGMNGAEVAEAAQRQLPGLGVVFMSGYTENAILHSGRLPRDIRLLQKPFRKEELATTIRAALDELEAMV